MFVFLFMSYEGRIAGKEHSDFVSFASNRNGGEVLSASLAKQLGFATISAGHTCKYFSSAIFLVSTKLPDNDATSRFPGKSRLLTEAYLSFNLLCIFKNSL